MTQFVQLVSWMYAIFRVMSMDLCKYVVTTCWAWCYFLLYIFGVWVWVYGSSKRVKRSPVRTWDAISEGPPGWSYIVRGYLSSGSPWSLSSAAMTRHICRRDHSFYSICISYIRCCNWSILYKTILIYHLTLLTWKGVLYSIVREYTILYYCL